MTLRRSRFGESWSSAARSFMVAVLRDAQRATIRRGALEERDEVRDPDLLGAGVSACREYVIAISVE